MPYNQDELHKLFQEYYIASVQTLAPHLQFRKQADPEIHQELLAAGYEWDEEKVVYIETESRNGQAISALPNDQFVWTIGDIAKVLKNIDKLRLWINGRGTEFLSKLYHASGYDSQITFKNTGERGFDYTPTNVDPTDALISKLKRQAGEKKELPSDTLIDVGLKAKKDGNQKLLDFLKTMNPIEEGIIKQSKLESLVQEIIKGILKETREQSGDDEFANQEAKKLWGDEVYLGKSKAGEVGKVYLFKTNQIGSSRLMWKDTSGQWKYLDNKSRKWVPMELGESRFVYNDNPEQATNVPDKPKTGNSMGKGTKGNVGPKDGKTKVSTYEPKTGTSEEVDEMTGTGAVAGYATPFAFAKPRKKRVKEEEKWAGDADAFSVDEGEGHEQRCAKCGELKDSSENRGYINGWICPDCRKNLNEVDTVNSGMSNAETIANNVWGNSAVKISIKSKSEKDGFDIFQAKREKCKTCKGSGNNPNGSIVMKCVDCGYTDPNENLWLAKSKKGAWYYSSNLRGKLVWYSVSNKRIHEMTTTGAVDGYNIPSAFAKKGGSKAGVEGSESLGYTLTPIGKKDMNRQADSLYEEKSKTKTKTCSHCNMMAVNGVWTHEQGCPNSKDV